MTERSRPSDSAAWRAHVDAAVDPRFERAFAILDALQAERQRPAGHGGTRIVALRRELARLLALIDGLRDQHGPGAER
ncbi:hypothetical protein [Actinomycetospora straminea]|uniref:Uncharacterized protein n=1 Tax=Actinomycetospora straminea TaxID=663607 RepID=A0ABP9ECB3_9PSEU|nr:hypothetical protein [Actinomycetospora straminea]MDD7934395.1 hypothetical protein [Actinomycetospora straminea]